MTRFRNPPEAHRFRPGQSGNPRGRPKKTRNVAAEVANELARKITVRENGVAQKMTKAEALAKALVSRALAGDMRAFGQIARLLPSTFAAPAADTPDLEQKISADDAAVLERFFARRLAATSSTDQAIRNRNENTENEND